MENVKILTIGLEMTMKWAYQNLEICINMVPPKGDIFLQYLLLGEAYRPSKPIELNLIDNFLKLVQF